MSSRQIIYIGNQLESRGGTPTSIDILAPLLQQEGYIVKTASEKKNRFFRLTEMLLLLVKNTKSTQVVFIDTYSTANFWYAYFTGQVCRKLRLNYIPLLHGGNLTARLKRSPRACESLFKNATLNIAPSYFIKEKFQQNGISGVQYIPNSLKIEEYSYKIRKSLKPKLLWVRAFSEIYDPLMAIQSLEILLKEFPDAELCMVGPEKDSSFQECMAYVEKKKLPVRFTGKLDKKEWHELAIEYDIFLNTTKIDNTPVSVIEAMALGIPVVSTNVGGIPYLIDNHANGVLVPPQKPLEMSNAIAVLLRDPDGSQKLASSARLKVEKFDWAEVKKMWHTVLLNID